MTENYTLTWFFFELPPILIGWLRDFSNDMMTPFNDAFSWLYTVLNGILKISDKLLNWLDDLIPVGWLADGLQDLTNFLINIGNFPTLIVVVLMIVLYGLYLSLLFFVVDLADRIMPT